MKPILYIAFLRAINVGGHSVTMEKLRALFTELGLENVRSYIQTGNIFFETKEADRKALTKIIEEHLYKALGYEVPTVLRTLSEVKASLMPNPFEGTKVDENTRLCMAYISGDVPKDLQLPYLSPKGDMEILKVGQGYSALVVRQQPGRPGNPGAYIEKTFGVKATIRFYATSLKILEAAQK